MRARMTVVAVMAALGLSSTTLAGGPGMHGGLGLLDEVELTDAQEEKVQQARDERREAHVELRAAHQASWEALEVELARQKPDRARLQKLLDERLAAQAELARADLDALLDITATFTPEQREQLVQAMADAKERRHDGYGPGKGRGGPRDGGGR